MDFRDFNRDADLIQQGAGELGQGVAGYMKEQDAEKQKASPDFMRRMSEAIQYIHSNPDVDPAQVAQHIKAGGSVADLQGMGAPQGPGMQEGELSAYPGREQSGGLGLPDPRGNPERAMDNMGAIFSNPEKAAGGLSAQARGDQAFNEPPQSGPQMSAPPMVQAQGGLGGGMRPDGLRIPNPQNAAEYQMLMQASPQLSQYSQNQSQLTRERENRASIERVNSQGNQSKEDIAGAERGRKEAESQKKGEQFQERMRQKGLDRASREAQVRMRIASLERNGNVANDPEFQAAKKQFDLAGKKVTGIEKSRVDFMADNSKADEIHSAAERELDAAAAKMEEVAARVSGRAGHQSSQHQSAEVSGNTNNPAMPKASPQGSVEWPKGSGQFWVRNSDGSKSKVQ